METIICIGIVGLFMLVLGLGGLLFTMFLYIVYKLDGGKMGIKEYFKKML